MKYDPYTILQYKMIESGLNEKDYWFFVSDFGKNILDYAPEKLRLKVNDFILTTKINHKKAVEDGINAVRSLIDKDYCNMLNLFK